MSKYYNILTIQQYLAGELDSETSYQLERDALQDPMLQDAIDGFEHTKTLTRSELSTLQQRLENRVAQQQQKRNHFFFGRQRLAIASVAGVLFILACTLFWMINYPLKKANSTTAKEISVNTLSPIEASSQSGNIEPVIGWEAYNHYLTISHTQTYQKGEVILSFEVENDRPMAIVVESSPNDQIAKELVMLIQEGPDWKGNKGVIVLK